MGMVNQADLESRVLVMARTNKDAANSEAVLGQAGFACTVCRDVEELCREIETGAGAVLLTEEAISSDRANCLAHVLGKQPTWSDVPVVALTRGGPDSANALPIAAALGNVILLERPVKVSTLVTAVRTALRARTRQYQSRAYLNELKEGDRRKDEFLATLAHELRNPLAPVRNALQLMRLSGDDRAACTQSRQMVERQIGHMVRLIDDLLDVSRVSRGKVELRRERLELRTVIHAAVEISRPIIEAGDHELIVTLPEAPLALEADATRLAQVVSNLLTNAAKYTEPGGRIWLSAQREGEQVVIRVRDTGIGIARDMLPRVFELFTQLDHSVERSQGGLGIGLTLVRALISLHGGRVEAASAGEGRGSEFTVFLPALPDGEAASRGCHEEEDPRAGAFSRRILVVDDNLDAADSLAMLLKMFGHEVRTAASGAAALAAVEADKPEVVFLDLGMPGMSGLEVARRLRQAPGGSSLCLVALTGWGAEEDRRRSREAGFDHHLVKPVAPAELQSYLNPLARETQAR
jgi:signal transduction histidine kinase/CheY-like chemotaxis protein